MLTKDTGIIDAVQKALARALLPTALMLTPSLPTATKPLKLQKNKTAA